MIVESSCIYACYHWLQFSLPRDVTNSLPHCHISSESEISLSLKRVELTVVMAEFILTDNALASAKRPHLIKRFYISKHKLNVWSHERRVT